MPAERKKRTITEIRDSKKTGEKMVYTSVLDYTSAKWAESAAVDVCVVGDSLAMTCHGHPNTIPATMDMMVLHAAAVRRGAPNTFVLGCMPYQSYHTVGRALANATRLMQQAACDAVKPQGGKSQAHVLKALVDAGIPTASHIGLTPHTIAMFGGFKIQGRTADAAMKILGAYGYSTEFPVERYYRDAKSYQIVEGSSNVQKMIIAQDALGYRKANRA